MFLEVIKVYPRKIFLGNLEGWIRLGEMYGSSKAEVFVMKWEALKDFHEFV